MTALPGQTALVLSGGEALGAYHAGAYAALHARGVRPDWIAGGSVGSIIGAIIVGNPAERRLDRLRAFWSFAASTGDMGLGPPGGSLRHSFNAFSGLQSLLFGRPGVFRPRFPGLLSTLPGMPRDVSLFDPAPLRANLPRFIDFDLLNRGEIRLSCVAVDIETGERVVFDNRAGAITAEHLLAGAAIPAKFPPVRIGDRLLADAGLASNLPVDLVFAEPVRDLLCLAVDLFSARGRPPDSIDAAIERLQDIVFANQSDALIRLLERDARLAETRGNAGAARLLHLAYRPLPHESGLKALDYSRRSIEERWAAGERDMAAALDRLAALGPPRPGLEIIRC